MSRLTADEQRSIIDGMYDRMYRDPSACWRDQEIERVAQHIAIYQGISLNLARSCAADIVASAERIASTGIAPYGEAVANLLAFIQNNQHRLCRHRL